MARTWSGATANLSAVSVTAQFKELFLALKVAFTSGGWTVTRSSNTVTAGAGDNWTTTADIISGSPGSWIVLQSPSGWVSPSPVHILLYSQQSLGDFRTIVIRVSTELYTGGTTAAIPTTVGFQTTLLSGSLLPWTTLPSLTAHYAGNYSSRGDIMFSAKETNPTPPTAPNPTRLLFFISSNEDSDGGGYGNYRWVLKFTSGANIGTLLSLGDGASLRGMKENGEASGTMALQATVWDAATAWPNGTEDDISLYGTEDLQIYQNNLLESRYLGVLNNLKAVAPNGGPVDAISGLFGAGLGGVITS